MIVTALGKMLEMARRTGVGAFVNHDSILRSIGLLRPRFNQAQEIAQWHQDFD